MSLPTVNFDAANALYAGRSIVRLTRKDSVAGFAAATSGLITKVEHGLKNGRELLFNSGTDGTGLTAATSYFVIDATTDTFKLSATPGGEAVEITEAYSEMSFTYRHTFATAMVTPKNEQEMAPLQFPDTEGVLRDVTTRLKSAKESFEFETPETKRVLEIFDKKLSGVLDATTELWIPDPQADADGYCALKSEAFDAKVTKNDGQKWGGGEYDKATLLITPEKLGAIEWDADADIS